MKPGYCQCHSFVTFKHVDVICKLSSYFTCECFQWVILHLPHSVSHISLLKLGWSAIFHTGIAHLFNYLVMMHLWSDPLVFPLPAGGFLYCTPFLFLYSLRNNNKQSIQSMSWNGRCNCEHSVQVFEVNLCIFLHPKSPSFLLIIS